jgi:hypothetical protein
MRLRSIGIGAVGALIAIGSVLIGAAVWIMLTDPVTIATAVNEGEITPFISDLSRAILDALMGLLKYL